MAERNAVIDSHHARPIIRQAQLAGMSRGSVYDVPKSVGAIDLALMRRLDALHLEHPFMGARMGLEVLHRKPNANKTYPGHDVFPYLLRGLSINRANQVWVLDTTNIPLAKGFVSLTAVLDWASRKVLAATVAITLETCHAVAVLHEAFTVWPTRDCEYRSRQPVHRAGVRTRGQGSGVSPQHGRARSLEG
jgi:putative transposase